MENNTAVCIKCGREVPPGNVFCADCLADMEAHPVTPGTPIQLPSTPPPAPKRAPVRRVRKPEEQVRSLRAAVVWLSIVLAVVIALSAVAISMLYRGLENAKSGYRPGENYNTTENSEKTDQMFHVKQYFDECFT